MALTGLTQLQPNNIQVVGIATFDQSVGIAGTLTYQDVTNVDAVGIVTARSGIDVSAGDLTITDKIVHAGDTNTTLRFPSADMITAETAGSERARFTKDGNLFVGSNASQFYPYDSFTNDALFMVNVNLPTINGAIQLKPKSFPVFFICINIFI